MNVTHASAPFQVFLTMVCASLVLASGCGGGDAMKEPDLSPFAGPWSGAEEYVDGTFADPLGLVNLGPVSMEIDAQGNITGQAMDVLSGSTYTLSGMIQTQSSSMGHAQVIGIPGPFNTATSPNLSIGGGANLAGGSLTLSLGSSEGECTISLGGDLFAGTYGGTVKSTGGSGTVSNLTIDKAGNVTGTYTIGGVASTITGTISAQDVATITVTPMSGTPVMFTGAAAPTGTGGDLTVYLKQDGSTTMTATLNLTPGM